MLGATQLMMLSNLDPHQQALLGIITNSIDQMRDVLTNVRGLAPLACLRQRACRCWSWRS